MGQFTTDQDIPIIGKIDRKIRVAWDRERAWHGTAMTIYIRGENLADGLAVELKISGTDGTAVETINAGALAAGAIDYAYTINWKTKVLPAGLAEFQVVASTQNPDLTSDPSLSLFVDLVPPLFSV